MVPGPPEPTDGIGRKENDRRFRIHKAQQLLYEGRYEESIDNLRGLLKENLKMREEFWVYLLLAENGRYKMKYQEGVPSSVVILDTAERSKELEKAAALLNKAVFSDGEKQMAYMRMGEACHGRLLYKEAEKYFLRAARFPGHPYFRASALAQAGHSMAGRGAKFDALRIAGRLEKIVKSEDVQPDILSRLGEIYYFMKEYPRARYWFEKTIEASPDTPIGMEAHIYMAWIDIDTGDLKSASLEFQKVLDVLSSADQSPGGIPASSSELLFGMMLNAFSLRGAWTNLSKENRKLLQLHAEKANSLFKEGRNKEMMEEMRFILEKMRSIH